MHLLLIKNATNFIFFFIIFPDLKNKILNFLYLTTTPFPNIRNVIKKTKNQSMNLKRKTHHNDNRNKNKSIKTEFHFL